jgi:hypothetical protein
MHGNSKRADGIFKVSSFSRLSMSLSETVGISLPEVQGTSKKLHLHRKLHDTRRAGNGLNFRESGFFQPTAHGGI